MNTMIIKSITMDAEVLNAFELLRELRPHLSAETYLDQIRQQFEEGYQLIGGLLDGQFVCAAGFRFQSTLARGFHLFVDDLVTMREHQGKGHGKLLLRELARLAKEKNVLRIYLDSRDTAKTFYEGCGFTFLTSTPCWIEVEQMNK